MTGKWHNLREWGIIVIGVLLVITTFIRDADVDRNYEAGLQSRAEDCRLQLGLGIPLGDGCLDPEMEPYFNPNEHITTGAFRAACQAQRMNHQPLTPGCPNE